MRKPVLFLLGTFFLTIVLWQKQRSDASWELCAELGRSNPRPIQVEGGWFVSKRGYQIQDPRICAFGSCEKLLLNAFVYLEEPQDRTPIEIWGEFQCSFKNYNPSQLFFLRFFERPSLVANRYKIIREQRESNFIDRFAYRHQKKYPLITALVESVWKGTTQSFPDSFIQFYRRGGMSHILAVSGTHVMVLFYLMSKVLNLLFHFRPRLLKKQNLWMGRVLLILIVPFLLWKYSPGNAPVHRTAFFFLTLLALDLKHWKSSSLQMVCSGLALLLLAEPALLLSGSFWLSSLGALFLSLRAREKFLKTYCLTVLLIPILMAPWVCSLFGEVSLASPLFSLLLSPVWDVALIPLGYSIPLVLLIGPRGEFFLRCGEKLLNFIAACQGCLFPLIDKALILTTRFNLLEASTLSFFLVFLLVAALRFFEKTS